MQRPLLILLNEHFSIEHLLPYHDHKILFIESYHELSFHKHHKKKLVFFISSMRHFYREIKGRFDVEYLFTDDPVAQVACNYALQNGHTEIKMLRPGEYRLSEELAKLCGELGIRFSMHEDKSFVCSIDEFQSWAGTVKGRLLLENFYRFIRLKTGILVEHGKAVGGKWNFDKENRNPLKSKIQMPNLRENKIDDIVQKAIEVVETRFADHFGDIYPFYLEVTKSGAERVLGEFLKNSLANFGPYQDAMQTGEELLFHSCLSSYLNIGFLNPVSVCMLACDQYHAGKVSIQSTEGFIRQILGWREFIRGIYWTKMPEYKELNFLNYENKLPQLYWDGQTDCNCLKQVIELTKKYAYSHHIQRLMVTGNFAALVGVKPEEICEWYLCVYSDAYEWVELPNTLGMATYADGGIVGTKPYIGSGSYINRMSDFCKNCKYKWDAKTGPDACPFNYLYWNFLIKHKEKLQSNPRMSIPYSVLDKMSEEQVSEVVTSAEGFTKEMRQY